MTLEPDLFVIAILFIIVISAIALRLLYVDHLDRQTVSKSIRETEMKDLYEAQIKELKAEKQILLDRLFLKNNLPPVGADIIAERTERREQDAAKRTKSPFGIGLLQKEQMKAIEEYDRTHS